MDAAPEVGLAGVPPDQRRRAASTRRSAASPTRCARSGDALAAERLPQPPELARRARDRPRRLRPRDRLRLDERRRSCSPAARRSRARASSTSATSCTRTRPTSAGGSRRAGWEVRHLPLMTILHHEGKAGVKPHIESLNAYTRIDVRAQVLLARRTAPPTRARSCCGTACARSSPAAASWGSSSAPPTARSSRRSWARRRAVRPASRVSVRPGPPELRALNRPHPAERA